MLEYKENNSLREQKNLHWNKSHSLPLLVRVCLNKKKSNWGDSWSGFAWPRAEQAGWDCVGMALWLPLPQLLAKRC